MSWDERDSSSGTTPVGTSDMADIRPDDAEIGFDDATEETGLLESNGHTRHEDSGWTGDDDFAGLPWWRRPSVCPVFRCPREREWRVAHAGSGD
jgi:hypothetical protein